MAQITLNSTGVASSGSLVLQTNGTTSAVTVDASQNVGIGVTPSASESSFGLQVGTAANTSYVYSKRGVANNAYYDGAWKYYGTGAATLHQFNSGVYSWYNAASGTAGNAITFTQVMTLDASGYLLVGGTSSAGAGNNRFQVGSTSSATSQVLLQSTTTSMSLYASSAAEFYASYATGSSFLIGNGPADGSTFTERARIDSSGRFLASTTSSINGGHTIQSINTSISTFGLTVTHTATTSDVRGLNVSCPNYSGDSGYLFIAARSGSDRLYIRTSGNVENTNNSYGALSDAKLKENVTDATPKLEKLNQVRIVNFNIIGDERKQIGVIAQELEQVFPGMIDESPDKDKEGNDLGTTTKSVKYSVFVPMLIKAMQEQQALITTLTQRITALEAK